MKPAETKPDNTAVGDVKSIKPGLRFGLAKRSSVLGAAHPVWVGLRYDLTTAFLYRIVPRT